MIEEISLNIETAEQIVELPFQKNTRASGLRAFLTLRNAGNMALEYTHRREGFIRTLGLSPSYVVWLQQIHSLNVIVPERGEHGTRADGMVSSDRELTLCVTVADCLPIFLYDKETGVMGLLHSGWKGTGIITTAVDLMSVRFGSRTENLQVLLGPCISRSCYKVDEKRYREYTKKFGRDAGYSTGDSYYLDMQRANLNLLARLEVPNVTVVTNCTHCHPALGSYRRDGSTHYTLMMAVMTYTG